MLSFLYWFRLLEAQVPKLDGGEVELADGDLLAWLLPFRFLVEVKDDSHLKHKISLNAKGPYLVRKLSDYLAPTMPSNVIA